MKKYTSRVNSRRSCVQLVDNVALSMIGTLSITRFASPLISHLCRFKSERKLKRNKFARLTILTIRN